MGADADIHAFRCPVVSVGRFQCLQLYKRESDDFINYACSANCECGRFQLRSLTEDQFKCLLFVCGLQYLRDAEIRDRILPHMQQSSSVTLRELAAECQTMINLKHDLAMVQCASTTGSVNADAAAKLPPISRPSKPPRRNPCPFLVSSAARSIPIGIAGLGNIAARNSTSHPPKEPSYPCSLAYFDAELKRLEEFGVLTPVPYLACAAPIVVKPEEDTVIAAISIEDGVRCRLSEAIRRIPVTAIDIIRATKQNSVFRLSIYYLQTSLPTPALTGDLYQLLMR
ncbi:unnamed protein product [Dibothriocephalus latus]|uniref:Uncharacterized protein n=1 Tax=Dibothriocephalus latus TaxID=60516 RepID=A0A3P7LCP2_DIBLA|nr:unnamed protein product [Dibothriocephalus latus]